MGDIIHTLPAVAWLKQSHPGSHLTWLVEPRWAPLLEDNPYVDRVVLLRRQNFAGLMETRRELRTAHYDFAVDFQGLLKSAMAASAAQSRSALRLPSIAGSRAPGRVVLLPQDVEPLRARGGPESGIGRGVQRRRHAAGQAALPAAAGTPRGRSSGGRFRARLSAGRMGIQAVADGPLPRSGRSPARRTRHSAGARRAAGRGFRRGRGRRFRTTPACPD